MDDFAQENLKTLKSEIWNLLAEILTCDYNFQYCECKYFNSNLF